MKRRQFITLLGSAVASWPPAVRAQEPAPILVVGFLHLGSPDQNRGAIRAFREGLVDTGFVLGKTVEIDFRWENSSQWTAAAAGSPGGDGNNTDCILLWRWTCKRRAHWPFE